MKNKILIDYITMALTMLARFGMEAGIIWTGCKLLDISFDIRLPIIVYLLNFILGSMGKQVLGIKKETAD